MNSLLIDPSCTNDIPWSRFLQFGSPHGLSSQAQYVAEERSEVWVNIGYRLSAFGFLACDEPRLEGNYGFKDQWLGLLWIKNNIDAFGGTPSTSRQPSSPPSIMTLWNR
jgi:hypothetical protein